MKKNIKVITISIVLVLAALATVLFIRYKSAKPAFTLEWHEIKPQTHTANQPLFESLKPVFIESFLTWIKPYAYEHDQRLANIPLEKKLFVDKKVVEAISNSLTSGWNKRIKRMYDDLQSKQSAQTYIVTAKDDQQKLLGFVLLEEKSAKDALPKHLLRTVEGSLEPLTSKAEAYDQMEVHILAVAPGIQKKGVGKALLFAAFSRCPHIKTLYLRTEDSNKNAQAFYEHVGFTRIFKGEFESDWDDADSEKVKIVYMYQK